MAGLVEVGILVLCATVAGVISNRFRFPPVLGLLLVGALIGPNLFAFVSQSETVEAFSEIGATLLLFAIGVEFSAGKLAKLGIRVFGIAVAKLAVIFFLAFQLSSLLGFGITGSLYLGAIMAITSTALTVKLVEQKGMLGREEMPALIAMLVVEDLFAVFALTIFSGMGAAGSVAGARELAYSILASALVLIVAYTVALKLLAAVLDYFIKYQAAETMTLLALGVGVGFSYFAQAIGFAPSIGAFLAGSMIASLEKGEMLRKSINPFVLAFSSIFFLSIGMLINFSTLQQNAVLVALLVVAGLVFKFIGTYVGTYMFGFSSKQSAFAGLAMLPVGEFSLLIAKQGTPAVGFDLIGLTSATVFFTTLATAIGLGKFESLNSAIVSIMPQQMRNSAQNASLAFFEATNSIEKAGKTSLWAAMQNLRYWIAGGAIISLGIASNSMQFLNDMRFATLTITQTCVLAGALVLAAGIQSTIMSMALRPTKGIERMSRTVSLFFFLLMLPFIASALGSEISQAELILLMLTGGIGLYVLYSARKSTRQERGNDRQPPQNLLFFKGER